MTGMGSKTTIAKASTIANSLRTTVPAAVVKNFDLIEGDRLDWTLKADKGEIVVVVRIEKKKRRGK